MPNLEKGLSYDAHELHILVPTSLNGKDVWRNGLMQCCTCKLQNEASVTAVP